ncbi:SipW-dependent-type signal peptide-containing protein [Anaerosacchariphilus polymeriproducens]|uniref:SipW-cognate class signal peptide n=1 Tax=Anaerosacchariphilus polymeriproducens TaxID=1812858 RepID=A0A371B094_9FIRM|nr:SipW-dependent-type signal peptide-containing protein [Anaerosacchariphilus polymeriproducens]RDU25162.1 hypothetical protein DWV06_00605 [Anaerosacchariphilus polymeriproducens]
MMTKKKKSIIVTVLALVVVMAIGGTLAYFTDKTDEKKNVFTMGAKLTGNLKEPLFNQEDQFELENNKVDKAPAVQNGYGSQLAKDFVPGRIITKDPAIENTSSKTAAWVALKISYHGAASSKDAIEKFAQIDWNTKDWTFNSDYTVAYYKTPLNAGEKTTTLLNKVTILSSANGQKLYYEDYSDFKIDFVGYLVQKETFQSAEEAMKIGFSSEFK